MGTVREYTEGFNLSTFITSEYFIYIVGVMAIVIAVMLFKWFRSKIIGIIAVILAIGILGYGRFYHSDILYNIAMDKGYEFVNNGGVVNGKGINLDKYVLSIDWKHKRVYLQER